MPELFALPLEMPVGVAAALLPCRTQESPLLGVAHHLAFDPSESQAALGRVLVEAVAHLHLVAVNINQVLYHAEKGVDVAQHVARVGDEIRRREPVLHRDREAVVAPLYRSGAPADRAVVGQLQLVRPC